MENSFGMETLFCIRRNERALKSEPIKTENSKILRIKSLLFVKIVFSKVNFTLAMLASDLKFTLANQIFHSPWRVWRVLFPPLGSYVFVDKGKRKPTTNIKKNKLI